MEPSENEQNATPAKKRMDLETFGLKVPFLKDQILSYLDNPSLLNYGLCSKDCNQEIQKFNKLGPQTVFLKNRWIKRVVATEVDLNYQDDDRGRGVKYHCEPVDRLDYGEEEATKRIMKIFKYVKNGGRVSNISVHLKKWPSQIMSLPQMRESPRASISIYKRDYEQFSDFLNQSKIDELYLVRPSKGDFKCISAPYMFPRAFFKSPGFKKLDLLWFHKVDCEIDEEDFVNAKIRNLRIRTSTIDESSINKKIRKWFEGESTAKFTFTVERRNRRRFDEDLVMAGMPFERSGGVRDKLRRSDGLVGNVRFWQNTVDFSVWHN